MFNRRDFGLAGIGLIAGAAGLRAANTHAKEETMTGPLEMTFEITKTEEEWRKILTSEQFRVLRKHGTERSGTSPLDKIYDSGTYVCAGCELPVFSSETKFDSGTGWPSYYAPADETAIATAEDTPPPRPAQRSSAADAAPTWAMFSTTAPSRPACGTVSTPLR